MPPLPPGAASSPPFRPRRRRLAMEVSPVDVRDAGEIERAVAAFASSPNGGLIGSSNPGTSIHRKLIIMLAARHKLPAVYFERTFAADGGLISYGPDFIDQYRQAAGYVDRILKGEKPADLPVQAPTKYRACGQPQDCQGTRPHSSAVDPCPRRWGDRITFCSALIDTGGMTLWVKIDTFTTSAQCRITLRHQKYRCAPAKRL